MMLGVVERRTEGLRYAAAVSATPSGAAPETRAGYSVTRSAIAERIAMTATARRKP